MSKLSTSKVTAFNRIVIQETLASRNIEADEAYSLQLIPKSIGCLSYCTMYGWPNSLLMREKLRKIKRKATKYIILSGKLYRMGKTTHRPRFLGDKDIALVLVELQKGVCSNHIRGKALAHKLLREGY